METKTIAPEFSDKLSNVIEKTMSTMGAAGYVWFFVYILVGFIDSIILFQK